MPNTKATLVNRIHNEAGLTKVQSNEFLNSLLEVMKQTLESGEDIMISGFGKFCVKEKNSRRGRNPHTGEDLMLDSRRVVSFQYSPRLRAKIEGQT